MMAFLHQVHPDYRFRLPSWEGLANGGSARDRENFETILQDIKSRRNLPGLLDVRQMFDWEAIKSYLEVNNAKYQFDAVAVDRLTRLETPGATRPGDRERALDEIIHDAQRLSRKFNDNSGIIVITPIEINREASKSALKEERKEGEGHYTLNAIRQHTAYQYDLDLCLSVFSDDDMKQGNQIEIGCVKARTGKRPLAMKLSVGEGTKMVGYDRADQGKITAAYVRMDTTKMALDTPPRSTLIDDI
jgi:hypothetical protein